VITDIRPRHTSADFVAFLNKLNRNVPTDLDVHVILDNLATHNRRSAGPRGSSVGFQVQPSARRATRRDRSSSSVSSERRVWALVNQEP
jgi:hypothetical protein